MREDLLDLLCCPDCRGDLRLEASQRAADGDVLQGRLLCAGCGRAFPIEDGIPNLLPREVSEEA